MLVNIALGRKINKGFAKNWQTTIGEINEFLFQSTALTTAKQDTGAHSFKQMMVVKTNLSKCVVPDETLDKYDSKKQAIDPYNPRAPVPQLTYSIPQKTETIINSTQEAILEILASKTKKLVLASIQNYETLKKNLKKPKECSTDLTNEILNNLEAEILGEAKKDIKKEFDKEFGKLNNLNVDLRVELKGCEGVIDE